MVNQLMFPYPLRRPYSCQNNVAWKSDVYVTVIKIPSLQLRQPKPLRLSSTEFQCVAERNQMFEEKKINTIKTIVRPVDTLLRHEIDGFDSLADLALDMRWSWNHSADKLWMQMDPVLWNLTRNPWVVLQTVSLERLQCLLADPAFREKADALVQARGRELESPTWFQQNYPQSNLTFVAYFSMEFMLNEALPIYSGGLGNVAGDQLKTASDVGVPIIGIGLLYQQGYFRQTINKDGSQQALFPYNDPGQLPISPLREENGEWLRLKVDLPGFPVWLRAWQVRCIVAVQNVELSSSNLDSNDAANLPAHRGITSELYGGGPELRLKQEMVL